MTTYTTIIMQMSQDRLKSRLKDFHLRFKFVDNGANYKVLFTSITGRPYITGLWLYQICIHPMSYATIQPLKCNRLQ